MVAIKFACALMAASLLTMVAADDESTALTWTSVITHIATPTTTLPASNMETIGCFETGIPLQNYGEAKFQSPGNCQFICLMLNKNVLGLSDGTNCWCGDKIPAEEWKVDNSTCSTTCSGTDLSLCGGPTKLWVMLTGNTRNKVPYYVPPVISSSSAVLSSSQKTSETSTSPASLSPSASSKPSDGGGTNTTAIAVGVVVGIVGLAAIIGGVLYFLRRRRQKQAENDYRRNAANVDSFVSGGKLHTSNSSMNDSRLDPIFVDRRQSNGSIADNEDYSRRILKVTNA